MRQEILSKLTDRQLVRNENLGMILSAYPDNKQCIMKLRDGDCRCAIGVAEDLFLAMNPDLLDEYSIRDQGYMPYRAVNQYYGYNLAHGDFYKGESMMYSNDKLKWTLHKIGEHLLKHIQEEEFRRLN